MKNLACLQVLAFTRPEADGRPESDDTQGNGLVIDNVSDCYGNVGGFDLV